LELELFGQKSLSPTSGDHLVFLGTRGGKIAFGGPNKVVDTINVPITRVSVLITVIGGAHRYPRGKEGGTQYGWDDKKSNRP